VAPLVGVGLYRERKMDAPMNTRVVLTAFSAVALLLSAATAFAHAELKSAVPPAGGTVAAAPNEVMVNFSEPLEPAFSTVVVRDSTGKQVERSIRTIPRELSHSRSATPPSRPT
jgi:methionine-rich copper-binding protein CopC